MAEAEWHPKIAAIHAYWQGIRPAPDLLPGRQHFEPLDVPDLLPHIWLVDVERKPFRLRFRLVGTAHVEIRKRDLTGCYVDEEFPTSPVFTHRAREVVATCGHSWRRGRPNWDLGDEAFAALENIILPLARDGRTVDMLLCLTIYHRIDGKTF